MQPSVTPADGALLGQLRHAAFDYFSETVNPANGLIADTKLQRYGAFNGTLASTKEQRRCSSPDAPGNTQLIPSSWSTSAPHNAVTRLQANARRSTPPK
jgi:hypothetical protein